ncbi:hypothetical protein AMTRI_Chr11g96000 [Amborella trichopoda]
MKYVKKSCSDLSKSRNQSLDSLYEFLFLKITCCWFKTLNPFSTIHSFLVSLLIQLMEYVKNYEYVRNFFVVLIYNRKKRKIITLFLLFMGDGVLLILCN